jgi:hypothetical protein
VLDTSETSSESRSDRSSQIRMKKFKISDLRFQST